MSTFVGRLPARISAALVAATVALPAPAAGQTGPLPRDSTARVERLAEGVYAIIHNDATDQWPHSNTGVVVYDDGVLVVDATYLPSRARADIALIRARDPRPRDRARARPRQHGPGALGRGEASPRDRRSAAEQRVGGTLRLGKRRVELVDRGRANSPHDVTVYLPEERVLFTGDILVQSPLPYTGMSWPVPWIEVLRELEQVPVAALVPGHGPVMRDHTYTREVRDLLQSVTSRVAAMARRGKPVEQIQDSLSLEDVRRKVPAWAGEEHDADWDSIVRAVIERAWRGVRGQG